VAVPEQFLLFHRYPCHCKQAKPKFVFDLCSGGVDIIGHVFAFKAVYGSLQCNSRAGFFKAWL